MTTRLEQIRRDQVLSIDFIANLLGVSLEFYSDLEKNETTLLNLGKPKTEFLVKLLSIDYSDIADDDPQLFEKVISRVDVDNLSKQDLVAFSRLVNYRDLVNSELLK